MKKILKKLSSNFIKNMAELHSLDYKKIGLKDFGKGDGYGMRQIIGWSERYKKI